MSKRSRSPAKPAAKAPGSLVPPLRPRPHPGEEAILWTPWKLWVTETRVESAWDVVLTRPVLAMILEQELAAGSDVGGVLGGKLFRCPTSGRRWVRADIAWRASVPLSEACDAATLATALGPAAFGTDDASLVRVGWYHTHSRLGVTLTESESQFHELEFPKPWQFALIPVTRSDPAGGVFQRGPGGILSRTAYAPFYELPRTVRSDGSRETMIHWQNYTTDTRVHLIDPVSLRNLAPADVRARGKGVVPPRLEAPASRPKRPRTPAPDSRHAKQDPTQAAEELRAGTVEKETRRSRRRAAVGTSVAATAVVLAGWFGWQRSSRGPETALEFSAPASPGTVEVDRFEPLSARAGFLRAMMGLDRALDTYSELEDPPDGPCNALALGVSRAEQAFLDAATAYAALGVTALGDGQAEYESAVSRMVDMSRHFASSGCARPPGRPPQP